MRYLIQLDRVEVPSERTDTSMTSGTECAMPHVKLGG